MEQFTNYTALAPKRVSPTTFVEAFARWVNTSSLHDMGALEYLITLFDRTDIGKRHARQETARRERTTAKPVRRKNSNAATQ